MVDSIPKAVNGKPIAIALMGPTASGKTDLAIALHQRLGAEIISVDSALVYRGLDIGSAKPSVEELAAAPHRLIDIRDPSVPYSAANFAADAKGEIEQVVSAGEIPLLVGGTMLYFKALLEGLSDMPASDAQTRQMIEKDALQRGWPALHAELAEIDPKTAAEIHPNHSHRIGRALEVYRISGKPISEFRTHLSGGLMEDYHWLQIAIAPRDRAILHRRIELRFDQMLSRGLIDEVQALFERKDLHADLPAIRAVGYRQVWGFLAGEFGFDDMRQKGVAATRQLAKRQLTWLRSWPGINWLDTQEETGELLSSEEIVSKALRILTETTI